MQDRLDPLLLFHVEDDEVYVVLLVASATILPTGLRHHISLGDTRSSSLPQRIADYSGESARLSRPRLSLPRDRLRTLIYVPNRELEDLLLNRILVYLGDAPLVPDFPFRTNSRAF